MPEGTPGFPPAVAERVHTGNSPELAVKLSDGDDPGRLLLVKAGAMDSPIRMVFVSTPSQPSHYPISFDEPLEAGE